MRVTSAESTELFVGPPDAPLQLVRIGYAGASGEFEKALSDIANGGKVADALDTAADAIDADLKKNNNYR